MSKLFHYDKASLALVKPWLSPPDPARPDVGYACQQQVLKLSEIGFVCLWDVTLAQQMHRFGMLQAKVSCDGAGWSYQRSAWPDGLARFGLLSDREFFNALIRALNGESLEGNRKLGPVEDHITTVLKQIASRMKDLSEEDLEALEAVVRLGGAASVLAFLESM